MNIKLLLLFPTLAVGLLDFKVDVVLARLEADFRDQPPRIPAVPNHQVSLQCPTAEYVCSTQPQSINFLQRICSAARKTVDSGQENVIYTSCAMKCRL